MTSAKSKWCLQAQAKQAESLVRLYDNMLTAAEALKKLAGEELRGAQAEHLEDEAAAKVQFTILLLLLLCTAAVHCCQASQTASRFCSRQPDIASHDLDSADACPGLSRITYHHTYGSLPTNV